MPIVHTEIAEHVDRRVSNEAIATLYRQWIEAASDEGLPDFALFDPAARPDEADDLMVIEPDGRSLLYAYYGRRIANATGFDMTGRRTSDFDGETAALAERKYRSVLETRRPLYLISSASRSSAVVSWERLIMPVRAADGRTLIVCYSVPLVHKAEILDSLMESSTDGIAVLQPVRDPDGRIADFRYLMINKRAGEILNRDTSSLIGAPVSIVFPEANSRLPVYREVMATGIPRQIELDSAVDGEPRSFRLSAVRAGQNVVVTLTDITEMRRMMEQLERQQTDLQFANDTLQDQAANLVSLVETIEQARADALSAERFVTDLMEAVPVPLFYWNPDGTLNRVNRHYAAVYGHTTASIIGKTPEDILPPHVAKYLREHNARLIESGGHQTYEGDVDVPGRGLRRFVVHRALVRDLEDRPIGIAGAMLDLTEEYGLRRELERLASTDPMTGLYNRRVFMERLEAQAAHHQRYGTPASLAILDVDHFKSVNDTYGHDFGDAVLVGLARLLSAQVRQGVDVVARFGGEEFVLLLPETDGPAAATMADRLRAAFAALAFDHASGPKTFSASVGVAEIGRADDVTSLLKRADDALYRSKHAGRNRVTLAGAPPDRRMSSAG
ncbi:hypothetical protein GCM10017083_52670 [Thalassobaculum fulvum]|uniref:diguanylate cyclase n=1 Tax=Thalassobaculum fulvum TaxID=1633335 RepID=A0A919CSE0_9PROT|nr:diguanylate cyclase [Thalassobaculum fulvum]GHD63015.1 hypothetical protein GCM10017083_52670 [Thalassobaculum fulvum]